MSSAMSDTERQSAHDEAIAEAVRQAGLKSSSYVSGMGVRILFDADKFFVQLAARGLEITPISAREAALREALLQLRFYRPPNYTPQEEFETAKNELAKHGDMEIVYVNLGGWLYVEQILATIAEPDRSAARNPSP